MDKTIISNSLFYKSICAGIVLWLLLFIVLPVDVVEPFKLKTAGFIILNYIALIIGYIAYKPKYFNAKLQQQPNQNILFIVSAIVVVAYVTRWADLFVIRELSFYNSIYINRMLSDKNYANSGLVFAIASIFKSLYFFPFVLYFALRKNNKKLLVFVSLILLFPLLEAVLKGNRKPFVELFLVAAFTLIVYNYKAINLKRVLLLCTMLIGVLLFGTKLLFKREKANLTYNYLLESRYNDLLKPKEGVKQFFNTKTTPEAAKFLAFTGLHVGQYFTHGVFEFNHIIDMDSLPKTNGKYTFLSIPKFINKTKLFKKILYPNPSPRAYVYLTTFGGLYIDFRWFSVAIMFVFGMFQKQIFTNSKKSIIWQPLLIYVLIINVFLLVVNYIRGAGIYPFIGFFLLLVCCHLFSKYIYEKSTNS